MSIRVMTMVWDYGPPDPTERFVLLAMADLADDEGICWPSMQRIASRCCMSERNARRIIRKLEEAGWVETEIARGRNKSSRYTITKPDTVMSARTDCPPGQIEHENRTNRALKPDTAMSAEPLRTVKEPSESNSAREISETLEVYASPASVVSFIAYRRKSKAKALSLTAAKRLANNLRSIFDAGGSPDDALGMAEERGWLTVEPDWYFRAKGKGNGSREIHSGSASGRENRSDPALEQIARLAGFGQASGAGGC